MDEQAIKKFSKAIDANYLQTVKELIKLYPSIVNADLRQKENQDHFTNGFALCRACKNGQNEMAKLLLQNGADPNAEGISEEDPPEFGMPICYAVEQENYDLANLLLSHGASVHAFPYCDIAMIDGLYVQARKAGAKQQTIRTGFSDFLGSKDLLQPEKDSPEVIQFYHRVLASGAKPTLSEVVRDEYIDLLVELLTSCPHKEAPKLSYPAGSVLESIIYHSSWHGYPDILELCMSICKDDYKVQYAKWSIHRAIISHNRDGSIEDYLSIIKSQLEYIQEQGQWILLTDEEPLYPFHLLAEHFCWHNNYGYKAALSTGKDITRVAKLFLTCGFDGFNQMHPLSHQTPIEIAKKRLDHPGISDYIEFLSDLI